VIKEPLPLNTKEFPDSTYGYVAIRTPEAMDPKMPHFTHIYSTPLNDLKIMEQRYESMRNNKRVGEFLVARFDIAVIERWPL